MAQDRATSPAAGGSSAPGGDLVLQCEGVHHNFGAKHVLHDVCLEIQRGEIVALVGPSGCGKSTLLNTVLGTLRPAGGRVVMGRDGERIVVDGPNRHCGMVYQHYSLFPFLTARDNVAFGPKLDQTSLPFRLLRPFAWRRLRERHRAEAEEMLRAVRIRSLHAYPSELSGGMRQRVAIAQALIMRPALLLLDEPFGALDEATREELQAMLLELYEENRAAKTKGTAPPHTILIVTHELTEAIYVADRVVGLSQYWDWKGAGHLASPGATIIYDKVAPVFRPGAPKRWEDFVEQRDEIRRVVFDTETRSAPGEHVTFWDDVRAGRAGGVMAP